MPLPQLGHATRPILCLDFDGVLHRYSSGWQGVAVIGDGPVSGAMTFLVDAMECFTVVIYSSRSKDEWGRMAMQQAIKEWLLADGFDPSRSEGLAFAHEKPAAFLTIDDRAICFEGTFPPVTDLLAFKPWTERGEG